LDHWQWLGDSQKLLWRLFTRRMWLSCCTSVLPLIGSGQFSGWIPHIVLQTKCCMSPLADRQQVNDGAAQWCAFSLVPFAVDIQKPKTLITFISTKGFLIVEPVGTALITSVVELLGAVLKLCCACNARKWIMPRSDHQSLRLGPNS
jgi:hypothetical protein